MAKGENRYRKQTHTDCRYGLRYVRVYTVYRPPNYGDLPTLHIYIPGSTRHTAGVNKVKRHLVPILVVASKYSKPELTASPRLLGVLHA